MLKAVLVGVAEEALRSGVGSGSFHGFVCTARARKAQGWIRPNTTRMPLSCVTVDYTVSLEGEVVQAGSLQGVR